VFACTKLPEATLKCAIFLITVDISESVCIARDIKVQEMKTYLSFPAQI